MNIGWAQLLSGLAAIGVVVAGVVYAIVAGKRGSIQAASDITALAQSQIEVLKLTAETQQVTIAQNERQMLALNAQAKAMEVAVRKNLGRISSLEQEVHYLRQLIADALKNGITVNGVKPESDFNEGGE